MKFKLFCVVALVCAAIGLAGCATGPEHVHSWDNGVITQQPTCTTEGKEKFTCTECEATEERPVPATGHARSAPVKEHVEPNSCMEGGAYDEVVYCLICENELSRNKVETQALGHIEGEPVKENEKPATCEDEGSYDEVSYCLACKEEISRVTKTVPASGHAPAEPVKENEKPATCVEDGFYDEVIRCKVCNYVIGSTHVIVPGGEGHVWNSGEVLQEHSLTLDGIAKYTCTICGDEDIRTIPAGADFAEEFSLTDGGAWLYGYVDYKWDAPEDFTFNKAVSNGTDAWTATNVQIKKGWIDCGAMTTIGYTVEESGLLGVDLDFTGGTPNTKLDLRVGIKSSDGILRFEPEYNGDIHTLDKMYNVSAGDTIFFIFSNAAGDVEGAWPNGDLSIKLSLAKEQANFNENFSLSGGGAWSYGYVDYKWDAPEDFTFNKAASNGTDAWTATNVQIKKGWIDCGAMTTIGYTAEEDVKITVDLDFAGGEQSTRLALRVGIKDKDGNLYSAPVFKNNPDANTLSFDGTYELKEGDTIYFIFSNEASGVEGAWPNGNLDIVIYKHN